MLRRPQRVGELIRWVGDARIELAADAAYCNVTVTRGLPGSFVLFGAMRPDAVLTALPDERTTATTGRRRRRGQVLPKPEAIARDAHKPWHTCKPTSTATSAPSATRRCARSGTGPAV